MSAPPNFKTTRATTRLLLLPLLLLFSFAWCSSRADDYALQTGPDVSGSSYAGSLIYNSDTNLIYVTGATYGSFFQSNFNLSSTTTPSSQNNGTVPSSSCFFGMVTGPSENSKQLPWWLFTTTFQSSPQQQGVQEACSALLLMGNNRVFIAGFSEENGILTRNPGENRALIYGMMLDLSLEYQQDSKTNETVAASASLTGGRLISKSNVQYPIGLTTSSNNQVVNLVSMFTQNKVINTDFLKDYPDAGSPNSTTTQQQPDFTTGGVFQFGSKYGVSTAKYSAHLPDASGETLSEDWFKATAVTSRDPIYATGVLQVNGADRLLVAGYTHASTGLNFAAPSSASALASSINGDMNGFVATRWASNGSYVDGVPSVRVQSTDGGDDYIQGICQCEGSPSNYIFVVGCTNGTFTNALLKPTKSHVMSAFLIKMNAMTLEIIWTQQLAAPNLAAEVMGVACAVTEDNDVVYLAGNIKGNNASFDGQEAWGDDDVFVAQYTTNDGRLNFVRQVGSPAKDSLARGGVVTDANGNALIMANTEGSWFRSRSSNEQEGQPPFSDIVIMSISKADGSFRAPGPIEAPSTTPYGSHVSRRGIRMVIIVASILGGIAIIFFIQMRSQPSELVETDRSHVLAYLKDFDVEDIDLRHSATGGWHCTYASNPAEKEHYRYFGIGGDEDDDEEDDDATRYPSMGGFRSTSHHHHHKNRDSNGGGYVDPLHAPLTTSTNPTSISRITSPKATTTRRNNNIDSLLVVVEDDDTELTDRVRNVGSGTKYRGLADHRDSSGFQDVDIIGNNNSSSSRSNKTQRRGSLNDESWGKEII